MLMRSAILRNTAALERKEGGSRDEGRKRGKEKGRGIMDRVRKRGMIGTQK